MDSPYYVVTFTLNGQYWQANHSTMAAILLISDFDGMMEPWNCLIPQIWTWHKTSMPSYHKRVPQPKSICCKMLKGVKSVSQKYLLLQLEHQWCWNSIVDCVILWHCWWRPTIHIDRPYSAGLYCLLLYSLCHVAFSWSLISASGSDSKASKSSHWVPEPSVPPRKVLDKLPLVFGAKAMLVGGK